MNPESQTEVRSEKKNIRILAVDDEKGLRNLLSFELGSRDYQVTTASNGLEAVEKFKEGEFDLVISDIKMPQMDGIAMLQAIKAMDSDVEVIMVTGYATVETAVAAMKKGAYDYVLKPFNLDEILMLIEKAVEKRQLRRSNRDMKLEIDTRKQIETELKKVRDLALEASKTKSDFLAVMSHEIRTPMNAIIGMSELLLETSLNEEQRKYLEVLRRGGETLLNLINDILDLSKVESGCLDLEKAEFDLREFMERTTEFMAAHAHKKGLELACHIVADAPRYVLGDANRLRQILINLVGNAIKFTERGEIVIEVKNNGDDRLLISVRDTGIGIPADKIKDVFVPFTQGDSSTTRKYGGTGLGLSISKKLVELMGGRIWLESQEKQGTVFYFTVCLGVVESAERIQSLTPQELKGLKTLVVDDNTTNQFILKEALVGWEMEAKVVSSGAECLEELKQAKAKGEPYQLLLLDCRMPEMDGFDVAGEIQKDKSLSSVVIMMLTSDNRSGDILKVKNFGLAGYLVKPIKMMDLREAVQSVLGKKETTGAGRQPTQVRQKASQGAWKPLKILLVEDSPDNHLLIQVYLKQHPCEIDIAREGAGAVEKFKTKKYDLVLMDMHLPGMDGLMATRSIRRWEEEQKAKGNGKYVSVPILALTANALKEDLKKSLDAGCNAHITKPVKKGTLLKAIEHHTGQ